MEKLALGIRYKLLFILQILDGFFTYLGVKKFGTLDIEGNPIVKYVMEQCGPALGLFLIKFVACVFIVVLFYETMVNGVKLKLFPRCLDFLIALYVVVVWTWYEILFLSNQPVGDAISKIIHYFQ